MDEMQNQTQTTTIKRKRKLTPFEKFSQTYLPLVIGSVALLLILVFLFGSIIRGFQYRTLYTQLNHDASVAAQQEKERLDAECNTLTQQAAELAAQYDYDAAITLLQSFSGNISEYPRMEQLIDVYRSERSTMVQWGNFGSIPNLSFEMLIVDPQRAFNDDEYASSYKKNFITTEEFSRVLEQLYSNGYILVDMNDLYEYKENESGVAYFVEKELLLPLDKKPLLMTQTNVNYPLYMVDSDKDLIADAGGAGFASKLVVDENGNLACEYVKADGTVDVGAYDLIPILEAFIATHPDFSYRGARATIALTGYNGLFGYRTHAEAEELLDSDTYSQQIEQAKIVARTLREKGYELACYTYENKDYSKLSVSKIKADMSGWTAEVVPILGKVETFVFAKNADLAKSTEQYSSDGYLFLQDSGFRFYLGYCADGTPWGDVNDQYVRQGRIPVTASNLESKRSWFNDILDPSAVLVEAR